MSKNTKIIAIVGGVLIVAVLAYMQFAGKTGIVGTFKACGKGSKVSAKLTQKMSPKEADFNKCMQYSDIVPMLTDKGALPKDKNGKKIIKPAPNKGKKYCEGLWRWKCESNAGFCSGRLCKCRKVNAKCAQKLCQGAMKNRPECKDDKKCGPPKQEEEGGE